MNRAASFLAMGLLAMGTAGAASAATITFPPDGTYGSPLVTPEATFTNTSGGDVFAGFGAMCFLAPGAFSCEADGTVAFASAVQNLLITTSGHNSGDNTEIQAFNGATLLGSLSASSDTTLDFSGLGAITNLVINDSSTGAGYLYAFSFDAAAVPEPGTMALLGAGLLGLGAVRRRRRA